MIWSLFLQIFRMICEVTENIKFASFSKCKVSRYFPKLSNWPQAELWNVGIWYFYSSWLKVHPMENKSSQHLFSNVWSSVQLKQVVLHEGWALHKGARHSCLSLDLALNVLRGLGGHRAQCRSLLPCKMRGGFESPPLALCFQEVENQLVKWLTSKHLLHGSISF